MAILIWSVSFLVALLWTAAAVIFVEAIQWTAQQLSTGAPAVLESATGDIVIPALISPLLEPATWATLFQSLQSLVATTTAVIPNLGSMVSWLVPLIWVGWALGLVVLLAIATLGTVLIKRYDGIERLAR
jgi:hypothetical protein